MVQLRNRAHSSTQVVARRGTRARFPLKSSELQRNSRDRARGPSTPAVDSQSFTQRDQESITMRPIATFRLPGVLHVVACACVLALTGAAVIAQGPPAGQALQGAG